MLAGLAARALPLLATAVALTGVANAGVQKLMGKGLYLDPVDGKGLQLFGDGLYLKEGNKIMDGRGILLGPNSPFRNIPILGMIL